MLLIISNQDKQWYYLAVKNLLALLRGITSQHCLSCVHSFATEKKLQSHKRVCKNKDFCNIIMSSEDIKILEYNQYQKSDKGPIIIYADLECIIEKIYGRKNNPEKSSTSKVSEHITSGFSKFTISLFRSIENKNNMYRGKDRLKKILKSVRNKNN